MATPWCAGGVCPTVPATPRTCLPLMRRIVVCDEYLTAEDARRDYSVAMNTETWTVDEAATATLRAGSAS